MDSPEYVRRQVAAMRRITAAVMQDLTEEQLNWAPAGTANSIGANLVHLISAEDMYVHRVLLASPILWDSAGWGDRLGLAVRPGGGRGWDQVKDRPFSLETLVNYRQAVQAATDAYLAALTEGELDRRVQFIRGEQSVADVLVTFVVHTVQHAGEISVLKGLQGGPGLPF